MLRERGRLLIQTESVYKNISTSFETQDAQKNILLPRTTKNKPSGQKSVRSTTTYSICNVDEIAMNIE